LVVCYILLFGWCVLRENYVGYSVLKERMGLLQKIDDQRDAHEQIAVLNAQTKCAESTGENRTLQHQNRDQQNTINRCQEDALKLLAGC
jgi:hypothetical protein